MMLKVIIHYFLISVSLTGLAKCQQEIATAYFNMAGVTGHVTFTASNDDDTEATINLNGTSGWTGWEIREFPVRTTDSCGDEKLGSRIHDLSTFQDIGTARYGTSVDLSGVPLVTGDGAILGRSLLLRGDNKIACATIQGDEDVYFSMVLGPVAGHVEIRPVGSQFSLFTDLFDTKSLQSSSQTLKIYSGNISADLIGGKSIDLSTRCSSAVSTSSPIKSIDNVVVSGGGDSQRFLTHFSLSSLNLSTDWYFIMVEDNSCSNVHRYERKEVKAVFSRDGVQGSVVFTQVNPYQPTEISVDLQHLQNKAGGYHVHEYPLPYQYDSDTNLCGPEQVGGHWNPLGGATSGVTQDDFEIGEISGKHGMLDGLDELKAVYTDLYAPLFGKHSIVGRSVVIHAADASRWVCASIGYSGDVVVAEAEFSGDVDGKVVFAQEREKPWTDTTVFVELTDGGETTQTTLNHNFHIHTDPLGDDYLSADGRCLSVQGHWNPFRAAVDDAGLYSTVCDAHPQACEVGDLNNKYHQTIDILSSPSVSRYLFTDQLPLSGSYSVIGRSLTIHQADQAAARYVCADIVRKLAPVLSNQIYWYGVDGDEVSNDYIKMSSSGFASDITSLSVEFNSLIKGRAGGYHIHELPVDLSQSDSSRCLSTAAHFNPYDIKEWDSADSLDRYEVADLSSKFGMLTGLTNYSMAAEDTNLPLTGTNSVVGRSLVIHEATESAPRWKCSDMTWDTQAMGGTVVAAKATFTGDIQGEITLSQVTASDGKSELNIVVMLWNTNGGATYNHNWHVHETYVQGSDCVSAGGHYNPFLKDVTALSYADCGTETPMKCEVGDLSSKLGTVDIGTKDSPTRYVFNDNFLSLSGKFSVMGRSIVIHAAEKGAARVACADLTPIGQLTQTMQYYVLTDDTMTMSDLQEAIEDQMSSSDYYNIYVKPGTELGDCTQVNVHFTAEDPESLMKSFNPDKLESKYRSVDEGVCTTSGSSHNSLSGACLLPLIYLLIGHLKLHIFSGFC